MTLVNKTIQVSTAQLNKTSAYCIVCPSPKVKSHSVPIYLPFTLFHLPSPPFLWQSLYCCLCLCVVHFKFNFIKIENHPPTPSPFHLPTSRAKFHNTLLLFTDKVLKYRPVASVKATTTLGEFKEADFPLVVQIANAFQKYLQLWLMQIYNYTPNKALSSPSCGV